MKIAICFDKLDPGPWVEALSTMLPKSTISIWSPGLEPCDIAIVWSPTQQFIDEQSNLKLLFNIGAGVDSILKLNLPESLKVVKLDNTDIATQMTEYVCHEVIRHFRKFSEYSQDQDKKRWTLRKPRNRNEFSIGVMGLGNIGLKVAKTLKVFDFTVNGYSRTEKHIEGIHTFAGKEQFSDFLRASRVLINLLPLTPDTQNILNKETLSQMQRGGYVINVARGDHLVDQDLISLIDEGYLSGATLDVFRTEPLPIEHPFWTHPNITVTPHISARMMRDDTIANIVYKIQALQRGEPITGIVDNQLGY